MDPQNARIPILARNAAARIAAVKHIAMALGADSVSCDAFITAITNLQPLITSLCGGCNRFHPALGFQACNWLAHNNSSNGNNKAGALAIRRENGRRQLIMHMVDATLANKYTTKGDMELHTNLSINQLNYMLKRLNVNLTIQHTFADAIIIGRVWPYIPWMKTIAAKPDALNYLIQQFKIDGSRANKIYAVVLKLQC